VVAFPNPRGENDHPLSRRSASDYTVSLISVMGITMMRLADINQQQHDVEFDLSGISNAFTLWK